MDIKPRKHQSQSVPGVIRRQPRADIGNFERVRQIQRQEISGEAPSPIKPEPFRLNTEDIQDNLETAAKKPRGLARLKPSHIRRHFTWRGLFKRMGLAFGSLVILGLGYLGYKLFFAVQNIIDRDSGGALALQDDIDPSQLKGEGDGRVNILLIGIGGDEHQGGDLADTIIVASIDPFNNEVAMLSIPRDLWVDIPGQWSTKINAAHALGEESGFTQDGYPDGGAGLLQKTVEQTLGIPIHYYARVDFSGFEQAIDAVGGIDVNVPEAICDYTISWQFDFTCIDAGSQAFNSSEALFYVRTRASTRGDFDRGERQRLILLALREKILSAGTFSDPRKVIGLIDAAGSHAATNIGLGEMKRIYDIISAIGPDKVVSAGLDDHVSTANVNGASAVVPKAGVNDFSEIQRYVRSIFIDGFIKKEGAVVDVLNGAGVVGAASATAEELESYGYILGVISDAPSSDYTATRLYDLSEGQAKFTKHYLEKRLDTVALSRDQLPEGIQSSAQFVIIVGVDATR